MIDIHNHSLFGVDDGPRTIEESVALLEEAHRQGIDTVILTPHYRKDVFEFSLGRIRINYRRLCNATEHLGIKLYLGCEYQVDSQVVAHLRSGRCISLDEGPYVLTEYDYETEYRYLIAQTKNLISSGYIPIIAHVERYKCLIEEPDLCGELQNAGALIQVNADDILGLGGRRTKSFCKKLLKCELVDIIASDTHNLTNRANHMQDCYHYVAKKYGQEYATDLVERNAREILNHDKI